MNSTRLRLLVRAFAIALAFLPAFAAAPTRAGGLINPFRALPWAPGGTQFQGRFGETVAAAGDVNGDGYGDVVVGAPREAGTLVNEGGAYLFLGSAQGSSPTHAWVYRSGQAESATGNAVASAGDVNGDGFADVLVGVQEWDTVANQTAGKVAVFHGGPAGLPATPTYELFSPIPVDGQFFGLALAPAGDVNGDGFADVLVGAFGGEEPTPLRGVAFVFHGGPSGLAATPARTWLGIAGQNS